MSKTPVNTSNCLPVLSEDTWLTTPDYSATDTHAKEVILIICALLLLLCSILLFFKHWKKNYHDINQLPYYAYLYQKEPGEFASALSSPPVLGTSTNMSSGLASTMEMWKTQAQTIHHNLYSANRSSLIVQSSSEADGEKGDDGEHCDNSDDVPAGRAEKHENVKKDHGGSHLSQSSKKGGASLQHLRHHHLPLQQVPHSHLHHPVPGYGRLQQQRRVLSRTGTHPVVFPGLLRHQNYPVMPSHRPALLKKMPPKRATSDVHVRFQQCSQQVMRRIQSGLELTEENSDNSDLNQSSLSEDSKQDDHKCGTSRPKTTREDEAQLSSQGELPLAMGGGQKNANSLSTDV